MPDRAQIINRSFSDIFSGEMRYVIPFFQRGYVWGSRNWNQLKQDIEEQILEPAQDGELSEQEHFFGPVVVAEQSGHPRCKIFDIIDGQQRFTTVYLMLAWFRRRLETLLAKAPIARKHYDQIGKWLINPAFDESVRDDYWKIKLFSVKGDRLATYYSVFGHQNPHTPSLQDDLYLYVPNGNISGKFERWMGRNFGDAGDEDIWHWVKALTECLKVVWIPLGNRDDPQAIFESLNDKGIQLTAAELLCNYLFRPLIRNGDDHESLHRSKWLVVQQIDRSSPVFDSFDFEEYLRHLFSIGQSKIIGRGRRLYVFFKQHNKYLDKRTAMRHLDNIAQSAPLYRRILGESKDRTQAVDSLLEQIRDTNMTSCRSFLLAVLEEERNHVLSREEVESLFREVYVLLVRRKFAELPVTRYDSFFPSLIDRIKDGAPTDVTVLLQRAIRKEQLWVGDDEFREAFIMRPVYRSRELVFTRLVMEELDRHLAQVHGGELPDYSTLDTVEHVAPQSIESSDDWKSEMGADAVSENYARIINTVGNLCLRKRERNSEMGRLPFARKQQLLRQSPSQLALDLADRSAPWNFAAITARSTDLAERAVCIWGWSSVS